MTRRDFEVRHRDGYKTERLFDAESLEELGATAFEMAGWDLDLDTLLEDFEDE